VPAATVWNAMTSYRINPHLTAQLNVINLTDELYYGGVYFTTASENHAVPAPGRTVKVALRASF
jgi:outer membrane receptor protein involved in Fe transport